MFQDKHAHETRLGPSIKTLMARHNAVLKRRCVCGKLKDPTCIKQMGGRRWISCHRCLGQIKQVS